MTPEEQRYQAAVEELLKAREVVVAQATTCDHDHCWDEKLVCVRCGAKLEVFRLTRRIA